MDMVLLKRRDHAASLVELVYATYGLTFHRDWLYNADRMLELNALGDITSIVAVEQGRVVGHLAMIRPHFDVECESGAVAADDVRECGLSIVHPEYRSRGIQVGMALGLSQEAWKMGLRGSIMRCVTHHTFSQRGALAMGGQPTALLLGSIPRWVSYDHDDPSEREPLSTLLHWVPVHPAEKATPLVRPPQMGWFDSALTGIRERRTVATSASGLPAESEVCASWSGPRRLAQVHVLRIGRDLVERLAETCRWLVGGHISHISVFLPGDVPELAGMHRELTELGLFPGGFIPGYLRGGRDAPIYQALEWSDLRPERIAVEGEAAGTIRDSVLEGWRAIGDRSAMNHRRKGKVEVQRTD